MPPANRATPSISRDIRQPGPFRLLLCSDFLITVQLEVYQVSEKNNLKE